MGQYYKLVNVDKKEYITPHDYDCGAKLMEHSYIGDDGFGNGFTGAFIQLLMNEWKGDCVVLVGDYADKGYMKETFPNLWDKFVETNPWLKKRREYDGEFYDRSLYECDEESDYKSLEDVKQTEKCPMYAINNDKHEFVNLYNPDFKAWEYDDENGKKRSVSIFALNLLIAVGNGLGGGDYCGADENLVGSWAGDSIILADGVLDGYEEVVPEFKED